MERGGTSDMMAFWLQRKRDSLKALEVAEQNISRLVMLHLVENSNIGDKHEEN